MAMNSVAQSDRLFTNPSASQQTQGRSSHDQRRTSIGQNNTVVNPLKLKRLIGKFKARPSVL